MACAPTTYIACRRVFDGVTNYTRLADYVWCLTAELLRHTSLTSLSLSTDDLQRLGSLKWAHNVCSQQQGAAASSRSRSIWKWYKEEYAGFATDSQHQVYWLPNWLASPPGACSSALTLDGFTFEHCE